MCAALLVLAGRGAAVTGAALQMRWSCSLIWPARAGAVHLLERGAGHCDWQADLLLVCEAV